MAWGQQANSTLPVAVITCGVPIQTFYIEKPNFLQRLFHLKQKKTVRIPGSGVHAFHESGYGVLTPETVARWREDDAERLGLRIPPGFCAGASVAGSKAPGKKRGCGERSEAVRHEVEEVPTKPNSLSRSSGCRCSAVRPYFSRRKLPPRNRSLAASEKAS